MKVLFCIVAIWCSLPSLDITEAAVTIEPRSFPGITPRIHPLGRAIDSSCTCGTINNPNRIVNGEIVNIETSPPWIAGITNYNPEYYYITGYFCGGSLINDRFVLTAAHCISTLDESKYFVCVGDHTLNQNSDFPNVDRPICSPASMVIRHPTYNSGTMDGDIALIQLKVPILLGDRNGIVPVCLPPKKSIYTNQDVTVSGWGTTKSGGDQSLVLLEVDIQVMSNYACNSMYNNGDITDNMMCATGTSNGNTLDSCQGDSGGPLVQKDCNGRYDQVGVVSWGSGCADPRYPGVYARVNQYIDWIKAETDGATYCAGEN